MQKSTVSKKNLSGGKGHRRAAGKANGKDLKNAKITQEYVDDVEAGVAVPEVCVARIVKLMGSGRMDLMTSDGETVNAGLKGSLHCSRGKARRSDTSIAAFVGNYVLLQKEDYGAMIIGVLNRQQVKTLEKHVKAAKGFFTDGPAGEEEGGFEFDVSEEAEAEEEIDVDAI